MNLNNYDEPYNEQLEYVRHKLTDAAIYEQMAEECTELAQALLKKARKLRNENYTPLDMTTIEDSVQEEFNDVLLCAEVLLYNPDGLRKITKLERWVKRLSEH